MEKNIEKQVKEVAVSVLNILKKENGNKHISLTRCIQMGFIVLDKCNNPVTDFSEDVFNILYAKYRENIKKFNNTLHKNFENIKNMSDSDYYRDQILHYFATYGLESIGFKAKAYIPCEALELPNEFNKGQITIIKMLSEDDFYNRIKEYLVKLKAVHYSMIEKCKTLLQYVDVECDELNSFELKAILCDIKNIVPQNPISFLRLMVYKCTGSSLLIKNEYTFLYIKIFGNNNSKDIVKSFNLIDEKKLASIFYRYKMIFLAFKKIDGMQKKINSIRRLAVKYHKPLNDVCTQNVINIGRDSNRKEDFYGIINKQMSVFDIVKCINSINNKSELKAYSIRNNKTFVKNNLAKNNDNETLEILKEELNKRIGSRFKGKTFLLPSYMEYALPTSEKQMLFNLPYGSYVKLGKDCMTLGIAWNNLENCKGEVNKRVDIDLHLMAVDGHFGWNANRQNEDVLYTGDMTDAKNGAAEAFWINNTKKDYMATCNLYTYNPNTIQFKFFVTKTKPTSFGRNYTYNPEEAVFPAIDLEFDNSSSLNLGLYANEKFYFYGNTISSGQVPCEHYKNFISALKFKLSSNLTFSELIKMLGGEIIYDEISNAENNNIINLLPANLANDTLFNLIDDNKKAA